MNPGHLKPESEVFNKEVEKLPEEIRSEVQRLLDRCKNTPPSLQEIWFLMDSAWDDIVKKSPTDGELMEFYNHPIWLLNGIFIEHDSASMSHRHAIADWIFCSKSGIHSIIDYGGGYGTFYKIVKNKMPYMEVEIFEPYLEPCSCGNLRANNDILSCSSKKYDCIVCIDVMEHLIDPVLTLKHLNGMLNDNGYAIFQNCFAPVIKCHLPENFHLRYTFSFFAGKSGFSFYERIKGTPALVFRKKKTIAGNFKVIRIYERIFKIIYPFMLACDLSKRSVLKVYRAISSLIRMRFKR